jgi:hypothetical protein
VCKIFESKLCTPLGDSCPSFDPYNLPTDPYYGCCTDTTGGCAPYCGGNTNICICIDGSCPVCAAGGCSCDSK